MQLHFDRVFIIFQKDYRLINSRLKLFAFVGDVFQEQGRIAVIMQNTDGRFEIIFHTMCQIGFISER